MSNGMDCSIHTIWVDKNLKFLSVADQNDVDDNKNPSVSIPIQIVNLASERLEIVKYEVEDYLNLIQHWMKRCFHMLERRHSLLVFQFGRH